MPKSTPYWGMLIELDILPIKLLIAYKRLMVYHNLMNSDDRRVARDVVIEQEKSGHKQCWFGNVEEDGNKIGIQVNEGAVVGKSKSEWKKEVKGKIRSAFEKEAEEKKQQGKKLRFLKQKGAETYLSVLFNNDAFEAMKIRLNMTSWIESNFGRDSVCPLCGEIDSTEHVFACKHGGNDSGVNVKDLENGRRMKAVVELFKQTEEKRREHLMDNIQINFDVLRREGTL